MKKRYINILLAGLLSTGMLSSCSEEFLDQTPYTELDATVALRSDNDVLSALYGAYSNLNSVNLYGRSIPVLGDLMADNTFVSTRNAGRYLEFEGYFYTRNSGIVDGIWSGAYTTILRLNNIINTENVEGDQEDVAQYKGEAYALRALMYFELIRFFGAEPYTVNPAAAGVPIRLTLDKDLQPDRNTVGEVYAQIESDLEQAYSMMSGYTLSGRFSKYAARGLQAKVSLTKGDYAKALEYAEDVIENGGFSLVERGNLTSYWSNPAASTSKGETLFEVIAIETDNLGTDELGYIYNPLGYGDILSAADLYNLYGENDARKELIIKGVRDKAENPAYIVDKFPNVSGDRDDKKVLRLSDVYLIAAEAAYRTGDEAKALEYLNDLVSERDPDLTYASSGDQLLEDILLERRKELAFEGDRIHTLDRLQRDVVNRPDAPFTVEFSNFMRVLPIPQSELTANGNIEQNPGW